MEHSADRLQDHLACSEPSQKEISLAQDLHSTVHHNCTNIAAAKVMASACPYQGYAQSFL